MNVNAAYHILRNAESLAVQHFWYFVWISYPWMLSVLIANFAFNWLFAEIASGLQLAGLQAYGIGMLVSYLFNTIIFSYIAISWHRRALRNHQRIKLPRMPGILPLARYWSGVLGLTFLTPIFTGLLSLPYVIFLYTTLVELIDLETARLLVPVMLIPIIIIGLIVTGRLSLKLPAAALNRRALGFWQSWQLTRRMNFQFLLIAAITFIVSFIVSLPNYWTHWMEANTLLTIFVQSLVQIIVFWLNCLLGVSVLSSTYDYVVTRRSPVQF